MYCNVLSEFTLHEQNTEARPHFFSAEGIRPRFERLRSTRHTVGHLQSAEE